MSILAESTQNSASSAFGTIIAIVVVGAVLVIVGLAIAAKLQTRTDVHHSGDVNHHHDVTGRVDHVVSGSVRQDMVVSVNPADRDRLDMLIRLAQPELAPPHQATVRRVDPPTAPRALTWGDVREIGQ